MLLKTWLDVHGRADWMFIAAWREDKLESVELPRTEGDEIR